MVGAEGNQERRQRAKGGGQDNKTKAGNHVECT